MTEASRSPIRIPKRERAEAGISSRRQPKQARSAGLVEAVLDAALQVLASEGARRFTTARVAERAGVSVGSLYQYFPNKAAILFRLQSDEWRRTTALLHDILADAGVPPLDRVRALVHAFVRSECEEAEVRGALDDAAPLYRDAPEARAVRDEGTAVLRAFVDEVLPRSPEPVRAIVAELIGTTMSRVGRRPSEAPSSPEAADAFAAALADMLCAYLDRLMAAEGGTLG